MAGEKFDSKSFNPQAFGAYTERIPNLKKNELIKSRALKGNQDIKNTFSSQTGARARNSKAVKALLDMDGLKLNDGKIIGLDEQLSQIKEENGFLFESDEPAPTIVKGTNGGSGGIGGKKPREMTYSELCDYMEQNPGAEIKIKE